MSKLWRALAVVCALSPAAPAGAQADAEFMPIDALGPAIQILFEALKETASR